MFSVFGLNSDRIFFGTRPYYPTRPCDQREQEPKVRPALRKAGRSPFETLSSELPPSPLGWLRVVPNPFEEVLRPALRKAGRSSSGLTHLGPRPGVTGAICLPFCIRSSFAI